jgi:hypothetical protein
MRAELVKHDENNQPTPEMLAAYADGELPPRECGMIERWLIEHPDARADVEAQRQLGRLWHATRPNEPDNETWTAALAGIRVQLPDAAPKRPHRRFPLPWLAGLAAAAAVAALAWMLTINSNENARNSRPRPEPEETPFPVASAEDVVITSLSDADDDLVLVGLPPLRGTMILADPGDVHMEDIPPNGQFSEPGKTPMIDMQPAAPK